MSRKIKCGECGFKIVKRQSAKGRSFPYKKHRNVKLLVDLNLYICEHCTNIVIAPGDASDIDRAILESLFIEKAKSLKIMFIGKSGAGKSTAAKYLKQSNGQILKLAKPIYEFQDLFYKKIGKKIKSQDGELLALLADRVNQFNPNYLFKQFCKPSFEGFVINDDCRPGNFENMSALGFISIKIEGTIRDRNADISKVKTSTVEWTDYELQKLKTDYTIKNSSTIQDLYSQLDEIKELLCG